MESLVRVRRPALLVDASEPASETAGLRDRAGELIGVVLADAIAFRRILEAAPASEELAAMEARRAAAGARLFAPDFALLARRPVVLGRPSRSATG